MKSHIISFIVLFTLVVGTSCNKSKHIRNKWERDSNVETVKTEEAQQPENEPLSLDETEEQLASLVSKWNESINLRSLVMLSELYDDYVYSYTLILPRDKVVTSSIDKVISNPSWRQEIVSEIIFDKYDDGTVKTSFTKQSNNNGDTHTYRHYIIWRETKEGWKIIRESDLLTDQNVAKNTTVPQDAISGDFDGDGITDHLWILADFDDNWYTKGRVWLKSDNPKLEGLSWLAPHGVIMDNIGKISDGTQDFLIVLPDFDSNWETLYTYTFSDGMLHYAIEPFTIFENGKISDRITPPKSGKKGYLGIYANDMADPENGYEPRYQEVKILR